MNTQLQACATSDTKHERNLEKMKIFKQIQNELRSFFGPGENIFD